MTAAVTGVGNVHLPQLYSLLGSVVIASGSPHMQLLRKPSLFESQILLEVSASTCIAAEKLDVHENSLHVPAQRVNKRNSLAVSLARVAAWV